MREINDLELYKKMLLIRLFEERVSKLRFDGEIYGAVHCCVGQEAVSVGVCMALGQNDRIIGTHRSHGYMIAKGANINTLMAEIFGKREGINGGRGGSLHACDTSIGALGATGIVGSGIPIAVGSAFASKYHKENVVSVAFLGDGAANEGVFFESLNLSSKWKLPVIFVVENNGVAVTTVNELTTANVDVYKHGLSFGMRGSVIEGQDPRAVFKHMRDTIDRVKTESCPEILEIKTYRFHEHAEGKGYFRMKGTGYRDEEALKKIVEQKDPITLFEKKLLEEGISAETMCEIKKENQEKVEKAVLYAKNCKDVNPNVAYDYIYV